MWIKKVSDKGFDAERRLFLVLPKFGFLSIKKRKDHLLEDESWWKQYRPRAPVGGSKVPPVQKAPRRVRDIGTRASDKRTLSRGVEVAREGTPQSVSFDTPFQTGERVQSVKMNFFAHGEDTKNRKSLFPELMFTIGQRRI